MKKMAESAKYKQTLWICVCEESLFMSLFRHYIKRSMKVFVFLPQNYIVHL